MKLRAGTHTSASAMMAVVTRRAIISSDIGLSRPQAEAKLADKKRE
jgi:hypothetical protein